MLFGTLSCKVYFKTLTSVVVEWTLPACLFIHLGGQTRKQILRRKQPQKWFWAQHTDMWSKKKPNSTWVAQALNYQN